MSRVPETSSWNGHDLIGAMEKIRRKSKNGRQCYSVLKRCC